MFPSAYTTNNSVVRPYWKLVNNCRSAAPDGGGMATGATGFAPTIIRPPAPIDFGAIFSNGGGSNGYFRRSNGSGGGEISSLIINEDMNKRSRDEIENESKRRKSVENGRHAETFSAASTSARIFSENFDRPKSSNQSENDKNNAKSGSFSHLSALNQPSQPPLVRKASKSFPKHPNRDMSKSATDLTLQNAATQSAAVEVENFNFSRTSLLSTSGYMFLPSKYTSTADASTETESRFKEQSSSNGLSTSNVNSSQSTFKIEKSSIKKKPIFPAHLPLRHVGTCQIISVETQRQIYIRPAYVKKDFEKFERDLSNIYEKSWKKRSQFCATLPSKMLFIDKMESIGTVSNQKDFYLVENKGEKKIYRVKIVADFITAPSKRNTNKEQKNRRKFFVNFIDYGYQMVVAEEKLKPVLPEYDFVLKTAPFVYRCNFSYDVVISERQKSMATSLLKLLLLVENNEFTYLIVENNSAETPSVELPSYPGVTLVKTGFADTISDIFAAFVSNKVSPNELSSLNDYEKQLFKNRNFRPFNSNDEDYNQFHFSLDDYKEILEILGWSKIIAESGKLSSKGEKEDLLVVDRIKKCKILLRRRMVAKNVVDWYNRQNENFDPSNICDDLDIQMKKMNLNY